MTDFNSSPFENTITSKSTLVPSDHQLDYNDGDTIRFDIPPFMSYIDPRQSVLKMNVKVRGSSIYRFNEKIGAQSTINNLRIYDGTQTHTLENLQSYSERLVKEYHYSENDSIKHKRDLLEGAESSIEDGYHTHINQSGSRKDTSVTMHTSQLGDGYAPTQSVTSAPELDGTTILGNPNTIEVVLPLASGILGTMSNRMFPAALTQGLKVEIDTNIATKALQLWSKAGFAGQEWSKDGAGLANAVYVPAKTNFAIESVTGGAVGVAMTEVKLYTDSLLSTSPPEAPSATNVAELVPVDRARNIAQGMVGASNLLVGRPIFAWTTGTFPATQPSYECIGVINKLTPSAPGAATPTVTVELGAVPAIYQTVAGGGAVANYTPTGARDVIPAFAAVAVPAATFENSGICSISPADSTKECSYTLSNIELVLKTAAPPKSYTDNLFRQTQTDEGAVVDFLTAETYRNNVNAGEVIAQINLPVLNRRAVSMMTLPINQSLAHSVLVDNFATTLDNIQQYSFIVNGKLTPTRAVLLGRLNNNRSEQVALWEIEKALSSAKIPVRNLNKQESQFCIARALARYGGVYNLAADGNISLRLEYSSQNLPVQNKLLTSYIYGLRRLRATKNGLIVEL
tara:strand:- start:1272 stop:3152 length:1881 start_codon:yes stop_codon:yes gene_type:complete